MMHQPIVFPSREAMMEAAAERLAQALTQGLTIRGGGCVALSGGATPGPAYERLAAHPMDWRRISFALADERFVPPDHEASNEGMLARTLAPTLSAGARLLPMYSAEPSVEQAALRADALYAPTHIDMALLGMGADGHVASWFPAAAGLAQALDPDNPRSVVALNAPQAYGTPERLSLTFSALERADRVLLLLLGDEKRARFEAALGQPPETAPAAALARLTRTPEVFWAA